MKKLLTLGLLIFLGFAPHVLAQGFTALAPIPGLTDQSTTSVINSVSLAAFFNNLYKYLIGLAATLAVIEIIWGGLEIATKDSVSKQSDGRERITQAIFGLVLVLSPVLVFSIINPSILNLSLNLPKLDLTTPPSTTSASATVNQLLTNNASNTNWNTPAGTLTACAANNDCTAAQKACQDQNTTGFTATPSVVCVNTSGSVLINANPTIGTAGVCPAQTTKQTMCITTASAAM
jgi:hypothetical protein